MDRASFDFVMYWIGETDWIQHAYWKDQETVLKVYREIDLLIEQICQKYNDYSFIIVSDHGFEGVSKRWFHVNEWLHKEEYLKLNRSPYQIWESGMLKEWSLDQGQRAWVKVPSVVRDLWPLRSIKNKIKYRLESHSPKEAPQRSNEENLPRNHRILNDRYVDQFPYIDWNSPFTVAYYRDTAGIGFRKDLLSNRMYSQVREEIIKKLNELTDEDGKPVIKEAWKREQVYRGKYLSFLPDIIFLPTEKYKATPNLCKNIFSNKCQPHHRSGIRFEGTHAYARQGILIAQGDEVNHNTRKIEMYIEDITPTILHLMDLPVPNNSAEQVAKEFFKEGYLDENPIQTKEYQKKHPRDKNLSQKEQEEIKDRLRGLGYLD